MTEACCGCGCFAVSMEREVPNDDSIQNGDTVSKFMPGDKFIGLISGEHVDYSKLAPEDERFIVGDDLDNFLESVL